MNLVRLRQAEEDFLQLYPGGFENPEITAIRKKRHNVDKTVAFAQEKFAKVNFRWPDQIVENMMRITSQSSVLSKFEKPRFKDFAIALPFEDKQLFAGALEQLLHGNEQIGFETMVHLLQGQRLAKWPLMTICQAYYHPQREVFVKPTTVKSIIEYFELMHLQYKPAPTWTFYEAYRSTLHEMKSQVDKSLSPTNLAFSWFLLLSSHNQIF
jgi:hypothetical protein